MSSPQITLQTVTGVDVELTIAGPGSRSYAFIVDWHIRLLLALQWLLVGHLIYNGGLKMSGEPGSGYVLWVWLPTLFIYFLYHPVLEVAMRGRTPGKRMAGVRLVTREGDIPGAGALLLRNVFRLLDSLPVCYLVGLATVVFTEQHVRIGDLAAGTLLRDGSRQQTRPRSPSTSGGQRGLTPQAADLIQELLDRWPALDEHNSREHRTLADCAHRAADLGRASWRGSARSTCAAASSRSWVHNERAAMTENGGLQAWLTSRVEAWRDLTPILDALERKRDHDATDALHAIELYRALGRDLVHRAPHRCRPAA